MISGFLKSAHVNRGRKSLVVFFRILGPLAGLALYTYRCAYTSGRGWESSNIRRSSVAQLFCRDSSGGARLTDTFHATVERAQPPPRCRPRLSSAFRGEYIVVPDVLRECECCEGEDTEL